MTKKPLSISISLPGASALGLSYLGVLKYFEENKDRIWIKQITGTSFGAIIGAIWACGMNHKKVVEIIKGLHLEKLAYLEDGNIFQKIYAILYGRYFLSKRLLKTFKKYLNWGDVQIPLTICATNINTKLPEYFSHNDRKISLCQAIYGSMNIPIIFKNCIIEMLDKKTYFYDGCFSDNNCSGNLKYNDYNVLIQPFGEKFKNQIMFSFNYKVKGIMKYIALIESMFLSAKYQGKDKYIDKIDINTGAKHFFDFTDEAIEKSIEIGYDNIKKYFDNKIIKHL